MGQLSRTMMRCFLWCHAIAFYVSFAKMCYVHEKLSVASGVLGEAGDNYCSVEIHAILIEGEMEQLDYTYWFGVRYNHVLQLVFRR
nr:unnamed protein product [Haemonchus contortus]